MFPVKEYIDQNVLTTLKGVTVDAGFNITLSAIRLPRRSPPPVDLLTIIDVGDDQPHGQDAAISSNEWDRPYRILVYRVVPDDNATPWAQLLNVAGADVQKALMADLYRGGWALNTDVDSPKEFSDENDIGGVVIDMKVHYRTKFDDPYTAMGAGGGSAG